jgi:hypothetical protein
VPVADEVGLARHASVVHAKQRLDVLIAQVRSQELAADERRVADDHCRARPRGLSGMVRVAAIQHRVPLLDRVERLEDRVAQIGEAVGEHPLNLADPDDDARELGGVGVQLDAEQRLGTDLRELHRDPHRRRRPQDRLALQVLEGEKGQVEEVAGAAGGIEDADGA